MWSLALATVLGAGLVTVLPWSEQRIHCSMGRASTDGCATWWGPRPQAGGGAVGRLPDPGGGSQVGQRAGGENCT